MSIQQQQQQYIEYDWNVYNNINNVAPYNNQTKSTPTAYSNVHYNGKPQYVPFTHNQVETSPQPANNYYNNNGYFTTPTTYDMSATNGSLNYSSGYNSSFNSSSFNSPAFNYNYNNNLTSNYTNYVEQVFFL